MSSPSAQDTVFYALAIPAALFFALATAYSLSIRGYRSLLDAHEPARFSDAGVEGSASGRRAGVGFAPTDYRGRPSFLQVWTTCAAPMRMDARRGSLATSVRELVGVLHDQETGVEALDRRFSFSFDDPGRMRSLAARVEFQTAMMELADLGVDLVRLEAGVLAAKKRATWIVPVSRDRAASILSALGMLARAMESALGATVAELEPPPSEAGPRRLVAGGIAFLSLAIGVRLVGAYWETGGWLAWTNPARWALVAERLPAAALLASTGALVAALLSRWNAIGLSLRIGWTVVLNAVLVWAAYAVVRTLSIPGLAEQLESNRDFIRAGLTSATVTAFGIVVCGFLGGIVGARLRSAAWSEG
ncbi:MAG TPA: hypothetical protein VL503_10435 [Candidatus Omnitrophota bacterium]|nr:hypothetical protein [Candidatus Omnitrophota bacterium]